MLHATNVPTMTMTVVAMFKSKSSGSSKTVVGADSADSGDDSEPDNPDAPDAAYEQLEARILQGAAQNPDAAQEDDDVDPAPPVLPD
jgi:hypothetical protein